MLKGPNKDQVIFANKNYRKNNNTDKKNELIKLC